MEQKCYNDKVIALGNNFANKPNGLEKSSNKSLIQLEATLLEMAATPQLCQGVLYMFPINLDGKYIVRHVFFLILAIKK